MRAHNDFNGDGKSDILWQAIDGTVSEWLGQADGGFSVVTLYYNVPRDWRLQGTGDFDGDGRSDVLLRNDDGTISPWLGRANGGFAVTPLYFNISNDWHISGIGDFNGDGRSDVLVRNDQGEVWTWLTQSNGGFSLSPVFYNLPIDWHIETTGDFNGDGRSDVLLWNDDGTVSSWLGQANGGFSPTPFYYSLSNDWHIVGTGDWVTSNGVGMSDILLRNDHGTLTEWIGQPDGGFATYNPYLDVGLSTLIHLTAVGDFNGDGIDDILFRGNDGLMTDWLGHPDGLAVNPSFFGYPDVPQIWHVYDPSLLSGNAFPL